MTAERAAQARSAFLDLSAALVRTGFSGWDPFDALASPVLRRAARTRLTRGGAIQLFKRSPVNLRPLFRVPRLPHSKGLALCTSAYATMAQLEPDGPWAGMAEELAERVASRALPAGDGVGWGYEFDVQTRWAYYRRGEPNAIVTVFAANALLDVAAFTDRDDLRNRVDQALAYARSQLVAESAGEPFFRYYHGSTVPIHNANALVAGLFARGGNASDVELAGRAVAFTIDRQRSDGTWVYGEGPRLQWIDGFHTAFVLDGLAALRERTSEPRVAEAIVRGTDAYISRLFDADGAPRATLESRWPIDVHAASTAIGTLSRLEGDDARALQTAGRVLDWSLRHLRRPDGRFAFQAHPRYRNSVPYFRWNDAHMLLALARYLRATQSADSAART